VTDRPSLRLERHPGEPGRGLEQAWSVRVPSDVGLVDAVVDLLASACFRGHTPSRQTAFRLRVALAEALANAILRGNGGDPDKGVVVRADLYADHICLSVEDEGPGFDPAGVGDPREPDRVESPYGRGLFIIRSLADEVRFNEKGNTIWMTLPRW
jgi:serine/threonine-protein kinase RsbW